MKEASSCLHFAAAGLLALALLFGDITPRSFANTGMPGQLPELMTPQAKTAIDKGLAYLARTQRPDGSWHAEGSFGTRTGYPCVMTSLAGLALMAGGHTPVEGKYAKNVRKAADFVLRNVNSEGVIAGRRNTSRPMYGHGFSMLFLAEVYGMEPNPSRKQEIKQVLERAVALTGQAQSKDGGWYYTPESGMDEGSVTVTQIQGLRASRNAAIKVPKKIINQATEYIQKCAQEDGGISYRLGMSGSRPAITAAAVATLYNAGEYDKPVAIGSLRFTVKHLKQHKSDMWQGYRGHSYYGMLYAGQAIWFAGGETWETFFPVMRDGFLQRQAEDGSWDGDNVGTVYGTAIALLTLQLPNQYLPILQR